MVDFKPANHLRKNGGEWDMQKEDSPPFFCGRSHRMIMVWECKRMHIAGAFHKSHSKARLTAVLGNERQRAMNER
ncbi:hypothetical protein B4100_1547 [Heyndrickxia coagulans]|nr:hypothetical protein B4100_1547 [Heyndrickxia coagulans]